ncbi:MAG TPA: hypothetical protein VMN60_11960 [Longimicrobiales bacterium]|nr:hypothetical protein [Longimicrobiales bacterium]
MLRVLAPITALALAAVTRDATDEHAARVYVNEPAASDVSPPLAVLARACRRTADATSTRAASAADATAAAIDERDAATV